MNPSAFYLSMVSFKEKETIIIEIFYLRNKDYIVDIVKGRFILKKYIILMKVLHLKLRITVIKVIMSNMSIKFISLMRLLLAVGKKFFLPGLLIFSFFLFIMYIPLPFFVISICFFPFPHISCSTPSMGLGCLF